MADINNAANRLSRRRFLQRGTLAAAVLVLTLAGCAAPAADQAMAVESRASQEVVSSAPTAEPLQEDWGVACRVGFVNDRYPGYCKRYIDLNNNGVCRRVWCVRQHRWCGSQHEEALPRPGRLVSTP